MARFTWFESGKPLILSNFHRLFIMKKLFLDKNNLQVLKKKNLSHKASKISKSAITYFNLALHKSLKKYKHSLQSKP